MGRTKRPVLDSANDPALDRLLVGVTPQKTINEKKFQGLLDHYNARNPDKEQGLSGVKLYIFRTYPRIDNKLSGRQYSNIELIECVRTNASGGGTVEELNELPADLRAYITQRHGGGRYRVSLNDKGRDAEQVAVTAIKIDELETDAVLDPAELVSADAETMGWITRQAQLGKLVKLADGKYAYPGGQRPAAATGSAAPGEAQGLAAVAMEAMRQREGGTQEHATKKIIDLVTDTANRQIERMAPAASDPVATVTAIVQALKQDNGSTSMVPVIVAMIQENGKAQMEAAKMQIEMMKLQFQMLAQRAGSAGGADDLTKLDKLVGIAAKLGSGGGGWMDSLKEYMPLLMPLLMRMAGMPGNLPAAAPAAETTAALPAANAAAGVQPGTRLTPAQTEDLAGKCENAMSRGQDGSDLANAIEVIFSPQVYDTLRAMGKDNLIALLLQSTRAGFFQARGEATARFIEEFVAYGDAEPSAPAPATPTVVTPMPGLSGPPAPVGAAA